MGPGIRMLELYHKLQDVNQTFQAELAFIDTWSFFAPLPSEQFEQLTSTGPHAGTLGAFSAGVQLRTRYLSLLETAHAQGQISFWASDSNRVIDSARYFAQGFFGWNHTATLHVIPETLDRGGDTLTPGRACANYCNDVDDHGRSYGPRQLLAFQETYIPAIQQRLHVKHPYIDFTIAEVYTMQEMCAFETLVSGSSSWCEVFSQDEWLSFEYARDLAYYYRAGPGNPYSGPMGMLWLLATAEILQHNGPDAAPLFLSFNHDGDIINVLSALNLFAEDVPLPTSHVPHDRKWRLSDVTPMGGRLVLERVVCPAPQYCYVDELVNALYPNHEHCDPPKNDTYVRLNINDGIVAIPGCNSANGCLLQDFASMLEKHSETMPSFADICRSDDVKAPPKITFLHQ